MFKRYFELYAKVQEFFSLSSSPWSRSIPNWSHVDFHAHRESTSCEHSYAFTALQRPDPLEGCVRVSVVVRSSPSRDRGPRLRRLCTENARRRAAVLT
jgi:hypothetical protein